MKLILDLDELEYEQLLFYYDHRPKIQENETIEVVAKKIFINGLQNNLVYARKRMIERNDLFI